MNRRGKLMKCRFTAVQHPGIPSIQGSGWRCHPEIAQIQPNSVTGNPQSFQLQLNSLDKQYSCSFLLKLGKQDCLKMRSQQRVFPFARLNICFFSWSFVPQKIHWCRRDVPGFGPLTKRAWFWCTDQACLVLEHWEGCALCVFCRHGDLWLRLAQVPGAVLQVLRTPAHLGHGGAGVPPAGSAPHQHPVPRGADLRQPCVPTGPLCPTS